MEAPQRWGHVCSALYAWNLANGTHLIFEGINVSTAGNIYILKYIWGKGDCMTVVKGTDFQGTSLTVQWLRCLSGGSVVMNLPAIQKKKV